MNDDELVEAIIEQRDKGNLEKADALAATLLVERHGLLIKKLAEKYCDDSEVEKSPLSEIYLYLRTAKEEDGRQWDYLSYTPQRGSSFKAWLATVVVHYYHNSGSDMHFVRPSEQDSYDGPDEWLYGESDGKQKIDQKTEWQELRDVAVDKIEESSHYFEGAITAFKMRYHGIGHSEIKDEIGAKRNRGALKQQYYRLTHDVREELSGWMPPGWS